MATLKKLLEKFASFFTPIGQKFEQVRTKLTK